MTAKQGEAFVADEMVVREQMIVASPDDFQRGHTIFEGIGPGSDHLRHGYHTHLQPHHTKCLK